MRPFPQQVAFVEKARRPEHARIFHLGEFGTGKSCALVLRLRDLVPPLRALVVCDASKVGDWADELARWGRRDWRVAVLGGSNSMSRRSRLRALARPHSVAIINREGLLVLGRLLLAYEVLIFDEVHVFANPGSQTSRAAAALSANARYVMGATGSPISEHLTDYYGVVRAVDPQAVPARFDAWLDEHFVYESRKACTRCGRIQPRGAKACAEHPGERLVRQFPKHHPRDGTLERLSASLHAMSYRCTRDELPVEWPTEIDEPPIRVELDRRTRALYDALARDFRLWVRSASFYVGNIRPRIMKLLQVCSGWAYAGTDNPTFLGRSVKLEALARHVEENRAQGRRFLIWAVYPPEIRMIGEMLTRMGQRNALCHGAIPSAERERAKRMFNDGYLDAIVANPVIWGPGVNLYAHFSTTFSRVWSGKQHGQKRGRPIRADSPQRRVVFSEIVATNTYDERCLYALEGKTDLLDEIMALRDGGDVEAAVQ